MDGVDETTNNNIALVRLGGYYYVEEQTSPDQYAYYRTEVTINTGEILNYISVISERGQEITVSD